LYHNAKQEYEQEFRVREARPLSRTRVNFAHAIEAVWANRIRSMLTMLGIFIGVAAVVTVCILRQGASAYFANQVLSAGANAITIDPGIMRTGGLPRTTAGRPLTFQDLQEVMKLPHVATSSPILDYEGGRAIYGKQNWKTNAHGVSADYQNIASWNMAKGLWFSNADNAGTRPVVVIGDTVYQKLFVPLNSDPLGKTITYQGQPFKIIGVLAPRGGFGQDDILYFPYNTLRYRLSKDPTLVDEIIVQTDTPESVDQTARTIQLLLERSHHIAKGTADDFTITTPDQLFLQAQQETSALTALLVGTIVIALTVGGISVMSIIIVSITERTREIGMRLSLGAKRSDIRSQFLIEALVLCLVGGVCGLFVGLVAGYEATTSFGFPFVTTWITFSLPFAVSLMVGLVFGLVPAVRASRLDPISTASAEPR
jgi:putative ABC transport system permease protein